MKRLIVAILAVALVAVAGPGPAAAQYKPEFKNSLVVGPSGPWGEAAADFAFGSTINWSPQVKELNLFAMPFMFPSYKALDAVQAGAPGQKLFKLIEAKGVVLLAWAENGFRKRFSS